jgi:xanthine dehydrogenase YagR molybdenum-binding subunit
MVDEPRPPFDDDVVRYYGQYVALAVADKFEEAKAAADAVAVTHAPETANVDPHLVADKTKVMSERGNAAEGYAAAPVTIDMLYGIAPETHTQSRPTRRSRSGTATRSRSTRPRRA